MKCPRCKGECEMMVDVTLLIPAELESRLTKKAMRRKDVTLFAANWPKARYFCKNRGCWWSMVPMPRRTGNEDILPVMHSI